jgi:hypothetical protein
MNRLRNDHGHSRTLESFRQQVGFIRPVDADTSFFQYFGLGEFMVIGYSSLTTSRINHKVSLDLRGSGHTGCDGPGWMGGVRG